MIHRDFPLKQGPWLVANVEDVQTHGGVCHAMTTEWLFSKLQNQAWDAGREYWRGVSHQRAYGLAWEEALKGLWGRANYGRYLQIALRPTQRFVQDPARRQGWSFDAIHFTTLDHLTLQIHTLRPNSGAAIVMFGSDPSQPLDSQNWGHTVGVVREADGTFRFLDVNEGQFSWPIADPVGTLAGDLIRTLQSAYGKWSIRDIYVYRVG